MCILVLTIALYSPAFLSLSLSLSLSLAGECARPGQQLLSDSRLVRQVAR